MAKFRINIGNTVVESEGSDLRDVIADFSRAAEVFSHSQCGHCQSQRVYPSHRKTSDGKYDYYSMKCADCGAELNFGVRQADNVLYPKRKDSNGNWLQNGGWVKFEKSNSGSGGGSQGF